jgi:hypothetical protein
MTKDAIWPACLDLYDVCFIVSRYRKSFFPSALGTWLSADRVCPRMDNSDGKRVNTHDTLWPSNMVCWNIQNSKLFCL